MTKYQYTGPAADYPKLGFATLATGAILDGTLSDPVVTTPPDARWAVYAGGDAETNILRYGQNPGGAPSPPEPSDGFVLRYSDDDNAYVPTDPGEFVALPAVAGAIDDAAETATGVVLDSELDTRTSGLILDSESDVYRDLSATIESGKPAVRSQSIDVRNLGKFRLALRRALEAGTQVHAQIIGDSVTGGAAAGYDEIGVDDALFLEKGYVGLFRALMEERYGDAGTGMVWLVDTVVTDSNNRDNRHAFTGTWTDAAYGPFDASCKRATSSGTYIFTPDRKVDEFIVYYAKRSDGGTISASVDGGTAVTASCNGSDTTGSVTVPASGGTSHVLTVTAPAASSYAYILAVEGRCNDGTVRVSQVARGGARASTFAVDASAIKSVSATFDLAAPDLTVINLGVNRQSEPTFSTDMQTIATEAGLTGSVLFIAPYTDDQVAAPSAAAVAASIGALGKANSAPVLNLYRRWGSYAVMNAAPFEFFYDDRHPSTDGHADIGSALFELVLNGPDSAGLNVIAGPGAVSSAAGSPNGSVVGQIGDVYLRSDGGAGTAVYYKYKDAGLSTGWTTIGARRGNGSPNGSQTGNPGEIFVREDAVVGTDPEFYIKVTGTSTNTGWYPFPTQRLLRGSGSPNGSQLGSPGDIYSRTDGAGGTALYVKESGSETTSGWIGIGIIGTGSSFIYRGSGSPNGSITAAVGSLYLRTDGGAGTSFYVKESGTGNSGWVGK